MIAELGQFCLILALMVAWVQFTLPMFGAHRNNTRLMLLADRAAGLQFLLIAIAFALLTTLFLTSDFSVKLVETHSHSAKPLLYKISGGLGQSRRLYPALGSYSGCLRRTRAGIWQDAAFVIAVSRTCRPRPSRRWVFAFYFADIQPV